MEFTDSTDSKLQPGGGKPSEHLRKSIAHWKRFEATRNPTELLRAQKSAIAAKEWPSAAWMVATQAPVLFVLGQKEAALRLIQMSMRPELPAIVRAAALTGKAILLQAEDEWQSALEHQQQALALYEQLRDEPNQAITRYRLGCLYFELREPKQALENLELARASFERMNVPAHEQAECVLQMGTTYVALGDLDRARELCNQAYVLHESAKNGAGMAKALHELGGIDLRQSQFAAAIENFQRAIERWTNVGDDSGAAATRLQLAGVYVLIGSMDEALTLYRELAGSSVNLPMAMQWSAHFEAAKTSRALGMTDDAIKEFENALRIAKDVDAGLTAVTLHEIGVLMEESGSPQKAFKAHMKAIEFGKAANNPAGVGESLHRVAAILQQSGKFDQARLAIDVALDFFFKGKDLLGAALITDQHGTLEQECGDFAKAATLHREALAVFLELNNRRGMASATHHLGLALMQSDAQVEAARALYSSMSMFRDLGLPEAALSRMQLAQLRDTHGLTWLLEALELETDPTT